jgi:hypothetical protein
MELMNIMYTKNTKIIQMLKQKFRHDSGIIQYRARLESRQLVVFLGI